MGHTLIGPRTLRGIAVLTLVGSGAFLAPAMAQASAAQPTTLTVVAAQSFSAPRSASTLVVSPSGIVPASSSAGLLVSSSSTSQQQSTYSIARKIVEFVLKKVGPTIFNKLKAAAKKGYAAFKSVWESTVAWVIRKAVEIVFTVYEIYQAIVEIFF